MPQTTVGDKVVLISGASSGIGAATAREFASQGAQVVLAARRADELAAQVSRITEAGGRALAIPTDITDSEQITQLVERTHATFGPIDILVNNAGTNWGKPFMDTSIEEIERMLQVNLLGTVLLTRAVLPEMQQRRHGAIISVGSVASHVPIEPLYSAAKAGVRGFSLALRRQLTGSGISVSLVSPGNINTQMTSAIQENMPEPEFVASAIANLAISPRREVIIPLKYQGIVWFDRLLPDLADFAFHWRHRQDRKKGNYSNLPAYARSSTSKIPE